MQNTMQMINNFINAGKQFDLQLYPRKTHGIAGQAARSHLYTRIREHFRRELLGLTNENQEAATPSTPFKLAPDIAEANLVHRVNPVTPADGHIRGEVVLDTVIGKQGNIEQLRAVSGHPMLIEAAINAVKQWTYKPYLLNGAPVAVETTVTIRFHM